MTGGDSSSATAGSSGAALRDTVPTRSGRHGRPDAMKQRTVVVTRAAAVGFAVGFMLAVVRTLALDPAPAGLRQIGGVAALIVGMTAIGIAIGLLLARSIPREAVAAEESADGQGFLLTTTLTVLLGVVVAIFIQAGAGSDSLHARDAVASPPLSGGLEQPLAVSAAN